MKHKRALFIGRFQPLHNGHEFVLSRLTKEKTHVSIIVGSSEQNFSRDNPLTIKERLEIVSSIIEKNNWRSYIDYLIPVADVPDNLAWTRQIIDMIPSFDYVVSSNQLVLSLFNYLHFTVKEWPYEHRDKWQGAVIRQRIRENKNWSDLVPQCTLPFLADFKFKERVRMYGV